MPVPNSFGRTYLCIAVLVLAAPTVNANVVDRDRIENIRIAGISLNYRAQTAFNRLLAAGYATDVDTYEEWWEPARSFVRGDPSSPSSSPDGYSEVVLERNGERLRAIRLTTINPNQFFNVVDEVEQVRTFLGIPSDAPRCEAVEPNGVCVAEDADRTAAYSLQLLASNQRYESAERINVPAVGYDAPPPAEPPPTDYSMLEYFEPLPATSDALDPCSLQGLSAALNPLLPEHEPEIARLGAAFLRDNPGSRTTSPAHFAESRVFGGTGGLAIPPGTPWCTSPFALSDVEWMTEQDQIGIEAKQDALIDEHMAEAMDYTALTETEIRDILQGNQPAGVRDVQVRRLYSFMEELGQRELALEVRGSSLVFWMFSPNLVTERAGAIEGEVNLNRPIRVVTRHGHHFGWSDSTSANLIVGLADPRMDHYSGATMHDPNDLSYIQPGAELVAVAMARPPHDPAAVPSRSLAFYGVHYPVPNTQTAIATSRVGGHARYRCGEDMVTVFQGEQLSIWGFFEGTLHIDPAWDPSSDWVEGDLVLTDAGAWGYREIYRVYNTGDPDCPYRPDVQDDIIGQVMTLIGRVRIPNRPGLPGVIGTRGRTVHVGPEAQ